MDCKVLKMLSCCLWWTWFHFTVFFDTPWVLYEFFDHVIMGLANLTSGRESFKPIKNISPPRKPFQMQHSDPLGYVRYGALSSSNKVETPNCNMFLNSTPLHSYNLAQWICYIHFDDAHLLSRESWNAFAVMRLREDNVVWPFHSRGSSCSNWRWDGARVKARLGIMILYTSRQECLM